MKRCIIDAHIHLDQYEEVEREALLSELKKSDFSGLVAVSSNLASCRRTLELAAQIPEVTPAFGFHPEQALPNKAEQKALFRWMEEHAERMAAVGEIGLPFYLRKEHPELEMAGYVRLLEAFLKWAKSWNKPVVLHAIYEDADLVCDLLEKHGVKKAHFHWFKGSWKSLKRMKERGYYISFTPDIAYEEEIQQIAAFYPLELMMMETDGPWPFEGVFAGKRTEPGMIHESIYVLSRLKGIAIEKVYAQIYKNTVGFYNLKK